jgi:hypothetical protein
MHLDEIPKVRDETLRGLILERVRQALVDNFDANAINVGK